MFAFYTMRCKRCGHEWLAVEEPDENCPKCDKPEKK